MTDTRQVAWIVYKPTLRTPPGEIDRESGHPLLATCWLAQPRGGRPHFTLAKEFAYRFFDSGEAVAAAFVWNGKVQEVIA